jgi:hypothetical protein
MSFIYLKLLKMSFIKWNLSVILLAAIRFIYNSMNTGNGEIV